MCIRDRLKPKGKDTDETFFARILFKKRILDDMKARRIALMDWCIVPSYLGSENVFRDSKKNVGKQYYTNTRKLSSSEMRRLRETSLHTYVRPLLQQYKPRKAVLLSKGIENQLGHENISNAMKECNVQYLGAREHPTSGRGQAQYLRQLRDFVNANLK